MLITWFAKLKAHFKMVLQKIHRLLVLTYLSLAGQPTSARGGKGLVNALYSFCNFGM